MPSPLRKLLLGLTEDGWGQLEALANSYSTETGVAITRTEAVRLALNEAAGRRRIPAVDPPPRGGRRGKSEKS